MNEKGNSTLLGIWFILLISLLLIQLMNHEITSLQYIKQKVKTYLCAKELNGMTKNHIQRMKTSNKIIYALDKAEKIYPYLKSAKKAAQMVQEGIHISHLTNLWRLARKSCHFDPRSFKTPYKHALLLKRNFSGEAISRGNQWKEKVYSKTDIIETKFDLQNGKIKSQGIIFPSQAARLLNR